MAHRFFKRPGRRPNAFTLVELLVVVAILALLLSLMGVVAARAREKSRVSRCKGLIQRIHVAMDTYKAVWNDYPSGAPGNPAIRTWPDPYDPLGVELERAMASREGSEATFSPEDLDPTDQKYFLDPWKKRIRYRKVSGERILIWSAGPNGVDEIGADTTGRKERGGDDISSVDVSF